MFPLKKKKKKKKKKNLDSKKIYLQNWTSIDLNSGVKAREIVECLSIKLKYHMNYQLIASSLYNYIFFVIIVKNLLDQNLLELDEAKIEYYILNGLGDDTSATH